MTTEGDLRGGEHEPEAAILARGLGKTYRVYQGQGRGWLKSVLLPFKRERFYTPHRALSDIDLDVPRGAVLGILGRNGSGKSTLLRLVAGISAPTSGTVEVRGRVRCLLSTGISFDPRSTGRQNILFGSAAMGIPKALASERMDEIIEFSELGEDIDKPTMFYSEGMRTKLAFAVAFQEIPEILLLDEAMAAGDMFFQHKCDQRVKEIVSSGSTVVMATHALGAIEQLCTHGLLLEGGTIEASGSPAAVLDRYREMLAQSEANRPKDLAARRLVGTAGGSRSLEDTKTSATDSIELVDAYMSGPDGQRADTFDHGQPVELHLRLRARGELPILRFTLDLMSEDFGVRLANTGTEHLSAETGELAIFQFELQGEQDLVVHLPRNPLGSGLYSWTLAIRPFDPKVSMEDYLKSARLAPFRSVSFPGHPIGKVRRMLLEPEVKCAIHPVSGSPNGAAYPTPARVSGGNRVES